MHIHQTTCRVIYGDTDNMGYAYNANYLRWFEIGRAEFFRSLGMTYKQIEERGVYLPLSEAHLKFILPAHYDDLLIIETRLDASMRAAMKFEYRLFKDNAADILASGYTTHAFINQNGSVIRPPAFIVDLLTNRPNL